MIISSFLADSLIATDNVIADVIKTCRLHLFSVQNNVMVVMAKPCSLLHAKLYLLFTFSFPLNKQLILNIHLISSFIPAKFSSDSQQQVTLCEHKIYMRVLSLACRLGQCCFPHGKGTVGE